MNLGLYRREHLHSGNADLIGAAAVEQFQRTHGAITAWQEVEHTVDGHHTDIHAASLDVAGTAIIGGDLVVGGGVQEHGRTVGLGNWTAEPFLAAHFGAAAPLTFAPTAAQILTNRYTLVGHTLTWTLGIEGAPIGGSGTGSLLVRLPGGCRAGGDGRPFIIASVQTNTVSAGTLAVGFAAAGSDTLTIIPLPAFAFAPATFLNLWGLITMEIQ